MKLNEGELNKPFPFVVSLYFFTNHHQIKKTKKPPEINITPTTERSHEEEQRLREGTETSESRRLPDVVIIGVKKSGTMTLGRRERERERERRCSVNYLRFCHQDSFLKHHPSISTFHGENGFFSINEQYRRGLQYLISTMPKARF